MFYYQKNKKYLMGILNTTPDSFFDGGNYNKLSSAVQHAKSMIQDGVDIIDIGGESSRPGAKPLSLNEERKRVIPTLNSIKKAFPHTITSVDTYKPELAQEALENGADIINDIYGLQKPGMANIIASYPKSYCIIMHMKGNPETMQKLTHYSNVIDEVSAFFEKQITLAQKSGIKIDKIILDPGIGFGKNLNDNILLIKNSQVFKDRFHCPVLIGASRKSMIGLILNNNTKERKNGSVIIHQMAMLYGADLIRVHDVKEHRELIQISDAFQK